MLYKNQIGVCLDESVAYLLEEKNDENLITIIRADETDENLRPKKKLRKNEFYRKVFELIRDFETISLFGSASSKKEIMRLLATNKASVVDIQSESASEVTDSQKIDFINNYFEGNSNAKK